MIVRQNIALCSNLSSIMIPSVFFSWSVWWIFPLISTTSQFLSQLHPSVQRWGQCPTRRMEWRRTFTRISSSWLTSSVRWDQLIQGFQFLRGFDLCSILSNNSNENESPPILMTQRRGWLTTRDALTSQNPIFMHHILIPNRWSSPVILDLSMSDK